MYSYQTAPSALPGSIKLENPGLNSLEFSWIDVPCGNRGGPLTYDYILTGTPEKTGNVPSATATIIGLTACSQYQFKVRAKNSEGFTDYTSSFTAHTDDEG